MSSSSSVFSPSIGAVVFLRAFFYPSSVILSQHFNVFSHVIFHPVPCACLVCSRLYRFTKITSFNLFWHSSGCSFHVSLCASFSLSLTRWANFSLIFPKNLSFDFITKNQPFFLALLFVFVYSGYLRFCVVFFFFFFIISSSNERFTSNTSHNVKGSAHILK